MGMGSGVVNVYKEKGWTSFDVVNKLRHVFGIKKIGHTGTLDPDATGVLPVCVGKATGLCQELTHKDKVYEAVLLLGRETDTQDISGTVTSSCEDLPEVETVIEAIESFIGPKQQIPPMYSAKKIDGKRLYELAREGKEVERKPVSINVYSIDILDITMPRVRLRIHCSSGTYIRTICHDIGRKLSCGGCMESLLRRVVGDFILEDTITIDEIKYKFNNNDFSFLTPIDHFFPGVPDFRPGPEYGRVIENGGFIPVCELEKSFVNKVTGDKIKGRFKIYHPDGRFAGIYEVRGKVLKPVKMYLEK